MIIDYSISIMKFFVKIVKMVIFMVYVFICTLKSEQPTFRRPPTHPNLNIVRIFKIRTYFWMLPKSISTKFVSITSRIYHDAL